MGCSGSSQSPVADQLLVRYPRTFEALFIRKDADKFIAKFHELDIGGTGRIRVNALLALSETPSTPFTEKIFRFMDVENRGSQDVRSFAFSTWNLCTLDRKGLASFVYDMYAAEDVRMDRNGMRAMLTDIYTGRGKSLETQEVTSLKKIIDKLPAERILSKMEFAGFCTKYSAFLQPLHRMQTRIREETFGVRYWNKLSQKRMEAKSQLYRPPFWAQLQARCFAQDARGEGSRK